MNLQRELIDDPLRDEVPERRHDSEVKLSLAGVWRPRVDPETAVHGEGLHHLDEGSHLGAADLQAGDHSLVRI